MVDRPKPSEQDPQHLCMDKGYDNPTGHQTAEEAGYIAHIRRIGEEKLDASGEKTIQLGVGWWSVRWPGYLAAVVSWFAMRRTPTTTWPS